MLRVDPGLRVTAANAAAHALLGRPPGTLVGRSVMEAFLDASVESMAQAALAQGTARTEVRRADADGPTLTVLARRAHQGGLWLTVDDVSELRRLQRIRTEFIDNLSHELRTPLTTVSLLAETLSREADATDAGLPPKMRDRIGKIEIETGHLVQMVNELLDLSRIESGGTLTLVDGLDMARLAGQSAERLRLFADRQGVSLAVDAPDGLPTVRGDSARLGQVVVNLVHNAVKFSPDGGDIVVRVRPGGRGDRHVGRGSRRRRPARCPRPGVRAVLQGRSRPAAGRGGRRHGPRARHRPPCRRAARRAHLGRVGRRVGLDVLVRAADRPRRQRRSLTWRARCCDWPIAATGGAPRRTPSRRCSPRSRCRRATASSSTSGCRPTASRSLLHDETLERVQGRPEPVQRGARPDALEDLGVPSLADVLAAVPHRAFLDVELKGRHDRAVVEVLAAGRGPGLVNAVVSSFEHGHPGARRRPRARTGRAG